MSEQTTVLPDGSAFFTASMPLPDDHWIYDSDPGYPPMCMKMGTSDPERKRYRDMLVLAGRYAVRSATLSGKEMDFDPDALIQNLIVGFLGYFTEDGLSGMEDWTNPPEYRKES